MSAANSPPAEPGRSAARFLRDNYWAEGPEAYDGQQLEEEGGNYNGYDVEPYTAEEEREEWEKALKTIKTNVKAKAGVWHMCHNKANPQANSPFFRLPLELKRQIYYYLVLALPQVEGCADGTFVKHSIPAFHHGSWWDDDCWLPSAPSLEYHLRDAVIPLLSTCKAMCRDVMPMFWGEASFSTEHYRDPERTAQLINGKGTRPSWVTRLWMKDFSMNSTGLGNLIRIQAADEAWKLRELVLLVPSYVMPNSSARNPWRNIRRVKQDQEWDFEKKRLGIDFLKALDASLPSLEMVSLCLNSFTQQDIRQLKKKAQEQGWDELRFCLTARRYVYCRWRLLKYQRGTGIMCTHLPILDEVTLNRQVEDEKMACGCSRDEEEVTCQLQRTMGGGQLHEETRPVHMYSKYP